MSATGYRALCEALREAVRGSEELAAVLALVRQHWPQGRKPRAPAKAYRCGPHGRQAGVRFRRGRWEAYIGRRYLGRHATKAEALAARKAAEAAADAVVSSLAGAAVPVSAPVASE